LRVRLRVEAGGDDLHRLLDAAARRPAVDEPRQP
jgi:hypothetical protein